jgi:hypothetical protein
MPDFMPRADAELVQWGSTFARVLAAEPGAFGVSADEAAECVAAADAFAQKHLVTANPGERSGVDVVLKNEARAEMKRIIRSLVGRIRANRAVSDTQLVKLSLKPRRTDYSKGGRHLPQLGPNVNIISVKNATFDLHMGLPGKGQRAGLPRNAMGVVVMAYAGDQPPTDPTHWNDVATVMRARVRVSFGDTLPPATKVWFCACYLDGGARRGPFGRIAYARVHEIELRLSEAQRVRRVRTSWDAAA